MTAFLNFLASLPALFKLVQTIQKRIDAAGVDRKVKDDVKLIHEVFQDQDAGKLNALFNSPD